MDNRYAQVFATYARRRLFLFGTPLMAFGVVGWLFLRNVLQKRSDGGEAWEVEFQTVRTIGVGLMTLALAMLAGLIAGHVKDQMANWRAKLWPGYRAPHIAVAALMLLATTIVLPIGLSFLMRASAIGFIAIVIWSAAGWAWTAHLQSAWIIVIWIMSWGSPAVAQIRAVLFAMINGDAPRTSWAITVAGIVALTGLLARLAYMHEEMAEYSRQGADPKAQLRPQMTGDATQVRIGQISASRGNISLIAADWMMNRIRNIRDASIFSQARHWRMASGTAGAPWVVASLMMLAALILVPRGENIDQQVFVLVSLMWGIMPTMVQAPFWPSRWPMLGYELTRPIDRRRFMRVMFTSFAWDVASAMVAFFTVGLIGMAIRWPGAIPNALKMVFVPITLQVFMCAAAIWIIRLRSMWISILALQTALFIPLFFLIPKVDRPENLSLSRSLVPATIFIMATVVIGFDAYRRWLKTNLD